MNAEFQSIARRDKKAFLSDRCKEIKENNRMRKTRDHFKKIRDTKRTFHTKMGSTEDRNGMDLTEDNLNPKPDPSPSPSTSPSLTLTRALALAPALTLNLTLALELTVTLTLNLILTLHLALALHQA